MKITFELWFNNVHEKNADKQFAFDILSINVQRII